MFGIKNYTCRSKKVHTFLDMKKSHRIVGKWKLGDNCSKSNQKGWQAMALCATVFAPSPAFRPYLEAHLEQVFLSMYFFGSPKTTILINIPPQDLPYSIAKKKFLQLHSLKYMRVHSIMILIFILNVILHKTQ